MAKVSFNEYSLKMNILFARHRKESDSAANKTTVVTSLKLIQQRIFASRLLEMQFRIAVSLNREREISSV